MTSRQRMDQFNRNVEIGTWVEQGFTVTWISQKLGLNRATLRKALRDMREDPRLGGAVKLRVLRTELERMRQDQIDLIETSLSLSPNPPWIGVRVDLED